MLTCPHCMAKFDPMVQPIIRLKKRLHVQCPYCKNLVKT